MNDKRWFNPNLPQTLVNAQLLCYIEAVFTLLAGALFSPVAIGLAAGAFGIANERKWGWWTASAAACAQVILLIVALGADVLRFPVVLNFVFDVALAALLIASARARTRTALWTHAAILIAVLQTPFYWLLPQIVVLGVAAGICWREDHPELAAGG